MSQHALHSSCSSFRLFCMTFWPSSWFRQLEESTSFHYFSASVHQGPSGWTWTPSKEFCCTQSRRRAAAGHSHCVLYSCTACLDSSKDGVAEPCDTTFAVTLGCPFFPPPQLCNAQLMSHFIWVRQGLLNTEVLSRALYCHAPLATWSMTAFCLGLLYNGIFTGNHKPMKETLSLLGWRGFHYS